MKIIDISKCNEDVISYINELQNKYAELEKLNKELDKAIIEFKKQIEEERKNYREIIGNFVDKIKELKGSE